MKKNLLILLYLFCGLFSQAQTQDFIHTNGKLILGPCGDTLFLKGINYAPYSWGADANESYFDEIAKTGANAVRIVWYASNPGGKPVYDDLANLDTAISRCVRNKMIAVVELHDLTGLQMPGHSSDPNDLITLANWWKSAPVLAILTKYKQSVIVNIANEVLEVFGESGENMEVLDTLASYINTYKTIINNLRSTSGFGFPIMIDAPDWGKNIDAFGTGSGGEQFKAASQLVAHDSLHNLIFSGHAYWYYYASTTDTTTAVNDVVTMLSKMENENVPFVLGEMAAGEEVSSNCQGLIFYQGMLSHCETAKIGWFAWEWTSSPCANLNMSTSGLYTGLTTYGSDIVNNQDFGMQAMPVAKSRFLQNDGQCLTTAGQCNGQATVTSCDYYVFAGETLRASGIYSHLFHGVNGCDSTVTLTLTVNHVDTAVMVSQGTLTAHASPATYQWINCSTGAPEAGATGQSYTASTNGSYAVVVSQNGCNDTSSCYAITYTGINELLKPEARVYPNPSTGLFHVEVEHMGTDMLVQVCDPVGRTIYTSMQQSNRFTLNLSGLNTGIYFVHLSAGNGQTQVVKLQVVK